VSVEGGEDGVSHADVILASDAVFTGLEEIPKPGAVAIRENKIIAVGVLAEMEPFIGSETKEYVFQDQLIMPGFHDFHIHLFLGSLSQQSVSLWEARSEEEAAEMVRQYAESRPDDPWVIGFSWYHVYWKEKRLPHRSTLDRAVPDRPVFLFNAECHGAWVNSKALELAGIDRDTPDPPFGEIMRDENGEPTGFLYETAMGLAKRAFELPFERRIHILQNFLDQAAMLGVTSVHDMFPLPGMELGDLELYEAFEQQGKLTTRIHFLSSLDGQLDRPRRLRERYRSDKLMFSGLKQFLDGVPTTYTAYMIEPYSDCPDTRGNTLIPPDIVKQWVIDADRDGFRIRLHACGDGAVRLGLDCYEAARQLNGARDSRHTIEHIEVIHPDDMNRFQELDVIASMQPEHLAAASTFSDNAYLSRFAGERERFTWPIRTLKDRGARLAFGSDFPVVGLNPLDEIYRAVTRKHNDGQPEGGWNPQERITLAEALRAYTYGSAYGAFREAELGTLEPGKLADIVVLDKNLFNIPVEQIPQARVRMTMMDGKVVYQAERNGGEKE
jgi:predicted amidohydrolase YtcJ